MGHCRLLKKIYKWMLNKFLLDNSCRMMASRVGLDTQGRLILRENGKIILPYEHFANAVMLKHMNGPHGLHLGLEATVRAVSLVFVCLVTYVSLLLLCNCSE